RGGSKMNLPGFTAELSFTSSGASPWRVGRFSQPQSPRAGSSYGVEMMALKEVEGGTDPPPGKDPEVPGPGCRPDGFVTSTVGKGKNRVTTKTKTACTSCTPCQPSLATGWPFPYQQVCTTGGKTSPVQNCTVNQGWPFDIGYGIGTAHLRLEVTLGS